MGYFTSSKTPDELPKNRANYNLGSFFLIDVADDLFFLSTVGERLISQEKDGDRRSDESPSKRRPSATRQRGRKALEYNMTGILEALHHGERTELDLLRRKRGEVVGAVSEPFSTTDDNPCVALTASGTLMTTVRRFTIKGTAHSLWRFNCREFDRDLVKC